MNITILVVKLEKKGMIWGENGVIIFEFGEEGFKDCV